MNKKDFKAKIAQLADDLFQRNDEIRRLKNELEFLHDEMTSMELQHKENEDRLYHQMCETNEKYARFLEDYIKLLESYRAVIEAQSQRQSQRQSQGDEP